jgi:magnesium transporter
MARLDKRLTYVRTQYESLPQSRINQRLNALTMLSAVFLPLTLMAGIWGMNFHNMPELERENAYFFAVSSMALVGLSLVFTFWLLGWFHT